MNLKRALHGQSLTAISAILAGYGTWSRLLNLSSALTYRVRSRSVETIPTINSLNLPSIQERQSSFQATQI